MHVTRQDSDVGKRLDFVHQGSFDFSKFDSETSNFDLIICTAKVFDRAI